jgi:cytochrome c oxidase subunit 2
MEAGTTRSAPPRRNRHREAGAFNAKAKGIVLALTIAIACVGLASADGRAQTSMLDPAGPRAARIADLWWVMFILGSAVFLVVMLFLVFALLVRGRRHGQTRDGENVTRPILIGVVISAVIMIGVFAFTIWTQLSLAEPAAASEMVIEVVGNQWWWEVRYPDEDVVTANEVRIPTGVPVTIKLTTDDVIHSFWVPRLTDKMDLIPGRTNELWLQADESGTYLGECAEFCGLQHALMQFRVIAEPPEEFAAWLENQRQDVSDPVANSLLQEGQQIFLGSACVYCHTVRGTNASGDLGPDLTHLASRQTLAAGTLDNNLGNLTAWIVDPQAIKPGNLMPNTNLDAEELQALVAYLMSLD